jgi:hypothetical protein
MKSAGSGGSVQRNRILRKKGGQLEAVLTEPRQEERIDLDPHRQAPPSRHLERRVYRKDPIRKSESAEWKPAPAPGHSGDSVPPVVQTAKEVEAYALKRADGICELCDTPIKAVGGRLTACLFVDLPEGKNPTTKDMAVLCPGCADRVHSQHLSRDIKILKRKARRKRISEVQISIRQDSPQGGM